MHFYDEYDLNEVIENGAYNNIERWTSPNKNKYFPSVPEVIWQGLPAASYNLELDSQRGLYFNRMDTNQDSMILLSDTRSEHVINTIDEFWKLENDFKEFQFLWKRGILLYGPPGSGKTATLNIVVDRFISNGGLVIYADNLNLLVNGLQILRQIEPERSIIVVLEDIDDLINQFGDSYITPLLDGEIQIENVVYLATTNHINRLDTRLTNRPSRFDEVIYIGMPNAETRKNYMSTVLSRKNQKLQYSIDELVELTEGFSIAHIKELIISVVIFNKDILNTIKKLRKLLAAELGDDGDDGNDGNDGDNNLILKNEKVAAATAIPPKCIKHPITHN